MKFWTYNPQEQSVNCFSCGAIVEPSSWHECKQTEKQMTQLDTKVINKLHSDVEYGTKFDSNKPPTYLLSNIAAKQTAEVLAFGAKKYAEHNWRKGMEWHRLLRAARDHICDFIDGEDNDPESGLSHLSHAACCIMFLQEYQVTYPELDTRYKRERKSD